MATAHIIHAFLGFTSTRLGSEVSCPRTLPGKNPEDLMRLEPRTPGLQVKHLTTERCGTLCGKRRKCWLPAYSPFPATFSKGLLLRVVKSPDCVVKS